MNRDEARKLLPIIQAYADGEQIQMDSRSEFGWMDISVFSPDPTYEYRIKPKPEELWVIFDKDRRFQLVFDDEDEAKNELQLRKSNPAQYTVGPYALKHFREVMDAE